MSTTVLVVLALALAWCLVRGEFSPGQASLGVLVGSGIAGLTGIGWGRRIPLRQLPRRFVFLGAYGALLLYDVVASNLALARLLTQRRPALHSGIVRLPLGAGIGTTSVLEAHSITVAPGQMVVDYSADERAIYVHLLDARQVESKRNGQWARYRTVLHEAFG
jgi:multicomponent K+:H+ antiporter subunit E